MQDNPFYPGYHPGEYKGDTPGSPFYPGYYPGQPIERKPIPRDFLPSAEYDIDMFFQAVNSADMSLGNELFAPKWFRDRLIDDFKQNTKAQMFPVGVTEERLDDYETESLPGAFGIGISLHPGDWRNPGEQFLKMAKSWGQAAVSAEDFDNRTRVGLWTNLVNSESFGDKKFGLGESAIFERAVPIGGMDDLAASTTAKRGLPVTSTGAPVRNNPLSLKNTGVYKETRETDPASGTSIIKKVDLGDKFGQSIIEFQRYRDNAFFRDMKFHGTVLAGLEFTQQELQDRKAELGPAYAGAVATNDLHYNIIFGGEMGQVTSVDATGAVVTETKKLAGMTDVNRALSDTKKGLEKASMGVASAQGKVEENLKTLKEKIISNRVNFEKQIKKANDLAAATTIKPTYADRFTARQQDRLKYLNELEKSVDHYLAEFKPNHTPSYRAMRVNLDNVVTGKGKIALGKGISGGDIIHTDYLTEAALDWLDEATVTNRRVGKPGGPRFLERYAREPDEDRVAYALNDRSLGLESSKVKTYLDRLHADRIDSAVDQFMNAFSGQRLIENFVWRRMSSRIMGYTPGAAAKTLLSQAHYFGLQIDTDFVTDAQKNSALFKKLYTYNFAIKHEVDGKAVVSTLKGSENFKAIGNFGSLLALEKSGELNTNVLKLLLTSNKIKEGMTLAETKDFLNDLKIAQGGGIAADLPFFNADPEEIKKFFDKFAKMKKELRHQLPGINWDDPDTALEFYRKLYAYHNSPDTVGINVPFVGFLQKAWMGLNRFQTAIMNSPLGKPIMYAFSWKNILVERATTLFTKTLPNLMLKLTKRWAPKIAAALISMFAGAGIAAPLMNRVILPIVRFFMRKGIDFGQAALAGLLKGDWEAAIRQLEKEVRKMVDTVTKILYIPVAIIMAVGMGFLGSTSTTVSPIDPYDSSAGYASGFSSFRPGENEVVRVRKDALVHMNDGSTQTNPDYIPNDSADSVTFRVIITPLITILDGSVEWEDRTIFRNESSMNVLFEYPGGGGREVLDPFENNVQIIRDFDVSIDGLEDGVVANTATVYTPAIGGTDIGPGVVNFTRSFIIGDFVPECPLAGLASGYHISIGSYETNSPAEHGSNDYWIDMCSCSLWSAGACPIPSTCDSDIVGVPPLSCECMCEYRMGGCYAPSGSENDGNFCAQKYPGNRCETYGYAMDIHTNADDAELGPVLAPPLGDPDRVWTIEQCGSQSIRMRSGEYFIFFAHLNFGGSAQNCPSSPIQAGEVIGDLMPWGTNTHLHIELSVNDTYVKPECYMCAVAIPPDCAVP